MLCSGMSTPSTASERFVVAGSRPWNRSTFDAELASLPGAWEFASDADELRAAVERGPEPRWIFFLHWSEIVEPDVYERIPCVVFHMTDLPFGRGGSPLQNLIVGGHRSTVLTALRMTGEVDAGPILLQEPLGLDGSAQEIYLRADRLAAGLIRRIVADDFIERPQEGDATRFRRRQREDGLLPPTATTLNELHDRIRMLDADSYPPAYLQWGPFDLEFRRSSLRHDRLEADVTIRLREQR